MSLRLSQINSAICKEGIYSGFPTTFVELHEGITKKHKRVSIDYIVSAVSKMRNQHVCIKGGEPLLQDESISVVYGLVEKGYTVNMETSCNVFIEDNRFNRTFIYTLLVKCPFTDKEDTNIYENLARLSSRDVVKFPIKDIEDYAFAKETIRAYPTKANLIFEGINQTIKKDLGQWLIEDKPYRVRLG